MSIPTTTQVFLNAAIADFSASLGWNGDRGTLTATVVDDPLNNLSFTSPVPGAPLYFTFSNWTYGGIFRDFVKISDAPAGITYKVNLTDPSEILQDVQLILDGYSGISPIHNLFNLYGYLETTQGFGAAQVNEMGMEYNILLSTLNTLANNPTLDTTIAQYGSFITLVNSQYLLDLSLMPQNLSNYRISGPTINLLDFIAEVCEDNSLDWFARLLFTGGKNVIQIVTASRANVYNIGAITQFIQSVPGAHSKGIGLELRNETTAKFLVGDNIQAINTFNTTFPSGNASLGPIRYSTTATGGPLTSSNTIDSYGTYPKDFAFNYKFGTSRQQLSSKLYPLCFPHILPVVNIQNNDIFPYWGTDVLGYTYAPSQAQEEKPFIDFLTSCFRDFELIRNKSTDIIAGNNGGTKNALVGLTSQGTVWDVCGKSILGSLAWYHDGVFFPSPIANYPYNISIGELRAALVSQDAWENYISTRSDMIRNVSLNTFGFIDNSPVNHKEIYCDYGQPIDQSSVDLIAFISRAGGTIGGTPNLNVIQANRNLYTRDDLLGISPIYALKDVIPLIAAAQKLDPDLVNQSAKVAMNRSFDKYNAVRNRIEKQYESVHKLASECYGRKFTISLRNVFVKLNDQLQPVYSDDPQSEGFFQGNSILGLNYLEQQFFTNQEGKIEAFVEFDSVNFIDLTRLNPDDYIIKDFINGTTYTNRNDIFQSFQNASFGPSARLYMKCQIEPNLVFGSYILSLQALGAISNSISYSDARLIVSLSSPVYFRNDCSIFNCRDTASQVNQLPTKMAQIFPNDGAMLYTLSNNQVGQLLDANPRDNLKSSVLNSAGGKGFNQEIAGNILVPRDCAYGLKSNTSFYGPWYAQGAPGKVEFEQDSSLNPWNFNGYTNMNLAGQAKVLGIASVMQFIETGSVEFPDVPSVTLGDVLIAGGPNVTDVAVTVGTQGVMTNYSMRSFSPSYGSMSKLLYQKIRDSSRKTILDQRNEKLIRGTFENKLLQSPVGDTRKLDIRLGTPHGMIVGMPFIASGAVPSGATVVNESFIEARADIANSVNYPQMGGISLDGLFRPYSTVTISGLPSFLNTIQYQYPSGGRIIPSGLISALNPFPSGHDISAVIRGTTLPNDLSTVKGGFDSGNNNRGMGIKLPAIGVGFGLDINDNYVPGNVSGYDSDYMYNANKWPCGPIDLRWDPINGVWTTKAASRTSLYYGVPLTSLAVGESGVVGSIVATADGTLQPSGVVINRLQFPICSGITALMFKDNNGVYNILDTQFNPLNVVTNVSCQSDGTIIVGRRTIYLPSAFSIETNTVFS